MKDVTNCKWGAAFLIAGLIQLLFCSVKPIIAILGLIYMGIGLVILGYTIIRMFERMNVYYFIHRYNNGNHLDNETVRLGKLSYDDLCKLNKYNVGIFEHQPIIIETIENSIQPDWILVKGYVKADNKKQAFNTLHYEDDFYKYKDVVDIN
jgi:hypothetical protein